MIEWIIGFIVAKHFYDKDANNEKKQADISHESARPKEEINNDCIISIHGCVHTPTVSYNRPNEDISDLV